MLKTYLLTISTCIVLASVSLGAQHHTVDCLSQTFTSQIGVREQGKNAGKQVSAYLRSCNLKPGYAWCGAFINWSRVSCGLPVPKNGAWAPAWFTKSKIIWSKGKGLSPANGDVFGLYYKRLKRIGHVGFIEKWTSNSSLVQTVEGNTNANGSREGDGVYRKYRSVNQIHFVARW